MDLSLLCFDIQELVGQHVVIIRDTDKNKIKYDNVVNQMNNIFVYYLEVIEELHSEGYDILWTYPEFCFELSDEQETL